MAAIDRMDAHPVRTLPSRAGDPAPEEIVGQFRLLRCPRSSLAAPPKSVDCTLPTDVVNVQRFRPGFLVPVVVASNRQHRTRQHGTPGQAASTSVTKVRPSEVTTFGLVAKAAARSVDSL